MASLSDRHCDRDPPPDSWHENGGSFKEIGPHTRIEANVIILPEGFEDSFRIQIQIESFELTLNSVMDACLEDFVSPLDTHEYQFLLGCVTSGIARQGHGHRGPSALVVAARPADYDVIGDALTYGGVGYRTTEHDGCYYKALAPMHLLM